MFKSFNLCLYFVLLLIYSATCDGSGVQNLTNNYKFIYINNYKFIYIKSSVGKGVSQGFVNHGQEEYSFGLNQKSLNNIPLQNLQHQEVLRIFLSNVQMNIEKVASNYNCLKLHEKRKKKKPVMVFEKYPYMRYL